MCCHEAKEFIHQIMCADMRASTLILGNAKTQPLFIEQLTALTVTRLKVF